jgi:PAS domain S-box-containing protein
MLNNTDGGGSLGRFERAWTGLQDLRGLRGSIATGGTLLAYTLSFVALEPWLGASTATLGLPLAAVIGALVGVRLGVVLALVIFGLSLLLLAATGYAAGDVVIRLGSGVGAVLLIGVAAGFGRMRDLGRRTSRLLAQVALDERRLRHIIAAAPVAIYAIDSRGLCTFAGGAPLSLVGLSEERLVGRPFQDFVEAPEYDEGVRGALAGRESRREIRYHGRVFDTQFAPIVDAAGLRGMMLVALDVTEGTETVDALRRSEERAQALLDSLPLIVLWVEADGHISSSEGSGLAALGLRVGALDGQSLFTLGSTDPEEIRKALSGSRTIVVLDLAGREVAMRLVRLSDSATPGVLGIGVVVGETATDAERQPARLGELLIDRGVISRSQLEQALADQTSQPGRGETRLLNELRNRLNEPQ